MPVAAAMLLFFVLLILSPLLFGNLMLASLSKLNLSPSTALFLVFAMFGGSLINIPVTKLRRDRDVSSNPLAIYGLSDFWPQLARTAPETIIAVNVGGCLVPVGLAIYEIVYLISTDPGALAFGLAGCLVNVVACYFIARPVKGLGIAMPALVSPVVSALLAVLLVPGVAPPVAFIIGVIGPLVGADLLHLKEVETVDTGVASIGGAGTFDGIVLSGIIAAYLA